MLKSSTKISNRFKKSIPGRKFRTCFNSPTKSKKKNYRPKNSFLSSTPSAHHPITFSTKSISSIFPDTTSNQSLIDPLGADLYYSQPLFSNPLKLAHNYATSNQLLPSHHQSSPKAIYTTQTQSISTLHNKNIFSPVSNSNYISSKKSLNRVQTHQSVSLPSTKLSSTPNQLQKRHFFIDESLIFHFLQIFFTISTSIITMTLGGAYIQQRINSPDKLYRQWLLKRSKSIHNAVAAHQNDISQTIFKYTPPEAQSESCHFILPKGLLDINIPEHDWDVDLDSLNDPNTLILPGVIYQTFNSTPVVLPKPVSRADKRLEVQLQYLKEQEEFERLEKEQKDKEQEQVQLPVDHPITSQGTSNILQPSGLMIIADGTGLNKITNTNLITSPQVITMSSLTLPHVPATQQPLIPQPPKYVNPHLKHKEEKAKRREKNLEKRNLIKKDENRAEKSALTINLTTGLPLPSPSSTTTPASTIFPTTQPNFAFSLVPPVIAVKMDGKPLFDDHATLYLHHRHLHHNLANHSQSHVHSISSQDTQTASQSLSIASVPPTTPDKATSISLTPHTSKSTSSITHNTTPLNTPSWNVVVPSPNHIGSTRVTSTPLFANETDYTTTPIHTFHTYINTPEGILTLKNARTLVAKNEAMVIRNIARLYQVLDQVDQLTQQSLSTRNSFAKTLHKYNINPKTSPHQFLPKYAKNHLENDATTGVLSFPRLDVEMVVEDHQDMHYNVKPTQKVHFPDDSAAVSKDPLKDIKFNNALHNNTNISTHSHDQNETNTDASSNTNDNNTSYTNQTCNQTSNSTHDDHPHDDDVNHCYPQHNSLFPSIPLLFHHYQQLIYNRVHVYYYHPSAFVSTLHSLREQLELEVMRIGNQMTYHPIELTYKELVGETGHFYASHFKTLLESPEPALHELAYKGLELHGFDTVTAAFKHDGTISQVKKNNNDNNNVSSSIDHTTITEDVPHKTQTLPPLPLPSLPPHISNPFSIDRFHRKLIKRVTRSQVIYESSQSLLETCSNWILFLRTFSHPQIRDQFIIQPVQTVLNSKEFDPFEETSYLLQVEQMLQQQFEEFQKNIQNNENDENEQENTKASTLILHYPKSCPLQFPYAEQLQIDINELTRRQYVKMCLEYNDAQDISNNEEDPLVHNIHESFQGENITDDKSDQIYEGVKFTSLPFQSFELPANNLIIDLLKCKEKMLENYLATAPDTQPVIMLPDGGNTTDNMQIPHEYAEIRTHSRVNSPINPPINPPINSSQEINSKSTQHSYDVPSQDPTIASAITKSLDVHIHSSLPTHDTKGIIETPEGTQVLIDFPIIPPPPPIINTPTPFGQYGPKHILQMKNIPVIDIDSLFPFSSSAISKY